MTEIRYAPGAWRAAVTPRGVVLLGPGASSELAARVWREVAAGHGLAAVLGALTGAFGTSLDAIPPFAAVLEERGAVRLAVRGELSVTVETASSGETVSGAGVTTWSERAVVGATRTVLRTPDPSTGPADLPVRDGVVLAAEIAIDWTADAAADAAHSAAPAPDPALPAALAPAPPHPSAPALPPVSEAGGLIDSASIPWRGARAASVSETDAAAPPPARVGSDAGDGLHAAADTESTVVSARLGPDVPSPSVDDVAVWGETLLRMPALTPGEERAEGRAEASVVEGDHDGETVSLAQSRAMRASLAGPAPAAQPQPRALGQVALSTGQTVALDRTVVIGRRPRSTRITGADLPHLIAVESPQQDISRSHLELRIEGDSIVATDLHTTNGTTLLRPGSAPVRLHPGEASVVVAGDVLDLGDGVTARIEEAP